MAKRYEQFCPIAHALSLVGERWSLLVVRELEAGGVVRKRRLPPPVASTVYELTEYGAGLEEAIHAIARWGARSLGPPERDDVVDPEWGLDAFPALLYPERARGLTETYVIGVDASTFTVRLEDGSLTVELGAAGDADLVAHMDMPTVFALASGDVAIPEAVEQGRVGLRHGDAATLARFFHVFSFAPRLATPADRRDEPRLGPRVRVETAIPVA